jgi:phosphatidylserine/phosphatidylglycerophosphate/cardiolipin synthase-like enzyme
MMKVATSVRGVSSALGVLLLVVGFAIGFGFAANSHSTSNKDVVITTRLTTMTVQSSGQPDLVEYCFSPGGDCANVVIRWIKLATSSLHVLIYSFTLNQVSDAIVSAKNRGVEVKIVMERNNANESGAEYSRLKNDGIDIRLDSNPSSMHDKVAIIDGRIEITGSFNWTATANSRNNENLVVIDSPTWAATFEAQFQEIYSQATS